MCGERYRSARSIRRQDQPVRGCHQRGFGGSLVPGRRPVDARGGAGPLGPPRGRRRRVLVSATAWTVWNQSTVNEKVYTVSMLSTALVLWLGVHWADDEPGPAPRPLADPHCLYHRAQLDQPHDGRAGGSGRRHLRPADRALGAAQALGTVAGSAARSGGVQPMDRAGRRTPGDAGTPRPRTGPPARIHHLA